MFVEVKWVTAKLAICGILVGIILLGVMKLNQSVANAHDSHSAEMLASENGILRSQLSLMSPRVIELEMQAKQLGERVNKFHTLLERRTIARDTAWRFTNATRGSKPRAAVSASIMFLH